MEFQGNRRFVAGQVKGNRVMVRHKTWLFETGMLLQVLAGGYRAVMLLITGHSVPG